MRAFTTQDKSAQCVNYPYYCICQEERSKAKTWYAVASENTRQAHVTAFEAKPPELWRGYIPRTWAGVPHEHNAPFYPITLGRRANPPLTFFTSCSFNVCMAVHRKNDTALGPADLSGPWFLVAQSLGVRPYTFASNKYLLKNPNPVPNNIY